MKNFELIQKLQMLDLNLEVGVINPEYLVLDKNIEPHVETMYKGNGTDEFLYSGITWKAKQNRDNPQEVIVLW